MADDISTITAQLQSDLKAIEPACDVNKGPLKRLYIDPAAQMVVREQTQIDRLIGLFTLQRLDNILNDEIDAQVSPFAGMGRFGGRPASGFITFFALSQPTGSVTFNIGDQIGDNSATLVYRVTQQITIAATAFPNFFNPITRRYEFVVPIEAISVGAASEVPENIITRILTPIDGIDGCINTQPTTNGFDVESNDSLDTRFRNRLEGQTLGTKGGLTSEIINIPSVTDVQLVTSADGSLFSRRTALPAIDLYVLGSVPQADTAVFTVPPSTTSFNMPLHNIISIDSVTLDGEAVNDFQYVRDPTALGGSVMAQDVVILSSAPPAGSMLEINYTYNGLLDTVQNRCDQFGDFASFGVDLLTYAAVATPLVVSFTFTFLSSFDKGSVQAALIQETLSYLNPGQFVSTIPPEALLGDLQRRIPTATNVTLTKFTTKTTSLSQVEVVQLPKNAFPTLSQSDLKISTATVGS